MSSNLTYFIHIWNTLTFSLPLSANLIGSPEKFLTIFKGRVNKLRYRHKTKTRCFNEKILQIVFLPQTFPWYMVKIDSICGHFSFINDVLYGDRIFGWKIDTRLINIFLLSLSWCVVKFFEYIIFQRFS